jgi:hypothetical protein
MSKETVKEKEKLVVGPGWGPDTKTEDGTLDIQHRRNYKVSDFPIINQYKESSKEWNDAHFIAMLCPCSPRELG